MEILDKTIKETEQVIATDLNKAEQVLEKDIDLALKAIKYEETKLGKIGYKVITSILCPIIRALWVGKVHGLENIPKEGGCIVAANHQSYFDFLCFTSISPRKIHYLAAEKFFESRLWRPLMQLTGQIKVERKSKDKTVARGQVISALEQGHMIGIFPEGTRSADGELNKAFTGIAKFALKAKVPIIPVGIIGTFDIMSRHDKLPKLRKADIIIGKPIHLHEHYEREDDEKIHRLVTDQVMKEIAQMIGKEYKHLEQ